MTDRPIKWLFALAVGMILSRALAHQPGILTPESPFGREVQWLFWLVIIFSIFILAAVYGGMFYIVWRFRDRGQQPSQITGNTRLEVIWTVIPLVIVFIIFAATVRSLVNTGTPPSDALVVRSTGYQYWWDFEYPEYGIRTANQLVVPVGRPIRLEGTSGDVYHIFWPADLAPNIDHFPGRFNVQWFQADFPGIYYGQCNQICGASHSYMKFRVIAVPQEEFDRYITASSQPVPVADRTSPPLAQRGDTSTTPGVNLPVPGGNTRGGQLFRQLCTGCHAVVPNQPEPLPGPNLAYYGNRTTLGAGTWPNEKRYLNPWIKNASSLKPGVKMPAFPQLSNPDLEALSDYLLSLRLPGFDFDQLPKR